MASEYSLTPTGLCMRASGSTTNSTAMAARAGTIIRSSILANSSTAKNQAMADLNSKAAIMKETLSMASFMATANITLLILVSFMKVNSKIIIWMAKVSLSGRMSPGMRATLLLVKCTERAPSILPTEIDT